MKLPTGAELGKNEYGLLDKSSLCDPGIHPLSPEKDMRTLNLTLYANLDVRPDFFTFSCFRISFSG